MWGSLRFRIAILVLATLVTVMVSLFSVSTMSVSAEAVPFLIRFVTLVALSLLSVLVLALSYLSLRQFVVPLRVLTETVEKIARGDYHAAAKPIGGAREIEQLRMALDHLAQQVLAGQDATEFYIARITDAEEEERKRLAREIHDDTIQSLVVLGQHVDNLRDLIGPAAPATVAATEIRKQVSNLSDSLRRFASDLRPPYLEDLGLLVAQRQLAQESGVQVQVTGEEYSLGADREIALYRIVQEALRNAVKHAHAQQIGLRVSFLPSQVIVTIADDGAGFDVPANRTAFARTNHFGLMGMQERAHLLGGALQIMSARGKGTEVRVSVPLTGKIS
jgi:signal transduction histidine kinase